MAGDAKGSGPFDGLSQWALDPRAADSPSGDAVAKASLDEEVLLPDELAALPFFKQSSLIGERIESWQIEALLGQGGMAAVYLANHVWLKQKAAVKVLLPLFAKEPRVLQRFQREAIAISRLEHPNIIEVKDFGFDQNHGLFMAMEYLEGQDLDSVMGQAPFGKDWILSLFEQICAGLQAIHDAEVLHRDLKPSNLFLLPGDPFPRVKILDFGVAKVQFQGEAEDKLTRTGVIIGTPRYLSPEQIHHLFALSPATDLYALGVILFESLTGHFPMESAPAGNFLAKIVKDPPALLSLYRPELAKTPIEAFVSRTLSKKADERPASATLFWDELQEALNTTDALSKPLRSPTIAYATPVREAMEQTPREVVAYETNGDEVRASSHHKGASPTSASLDQSALSSSSRSVDAVSTVSAENAASSTTSPLMVRLVGVVIVLLVCLLGGVVWYAMELRQQNTKQQARQTPNTPPHRSATSGLLDGLVIQGRKALKDGNPKRAVTLWKKATKQPMWKKSPHYPKLYRAIGVALVRQKKLHSAVVYYQKYKRGIKAEKERIRKLQQRLGEAKQDLVRRKALAGRLARLLKRIPRDDEVKRELKSMAELEVELKKRAAKTSLMLAAFQSRWSAKQWKASFKHLRQLQRRAPSIPGLHIKIARILSQQFASLALAQIDAIVRQMEPTSAQRAELIAMKKALQKRQASSEATWRKGLHAVMLLLSRGKTSKGIGILRKQFRGRFLANGGLHQIWRAWLRKESQKAPLKSRGLWRLYASTLRRLQREGLWSWLRLQDPLAMAPRQAVRMGGLMREMARALKRKDAAELALRKGDVRAAVRIARAFLRSARLLRAVDSWKVSDILLPHIATMASMKKQFAPLAEQLADANRSYLEARLERAKQLHQKILAALSEGGARVQMSRLFARREARLNEAERALKTGHRAFAKFKWARARKSYQKYQKMFPKTHQGSLLKRRLKVCRCLLKIFPWEVCSHLQMPRGYQAPGGR